MGKLKKVGIGVGVIIGIFVLLIILSQMWLASLTPEERQQLEDEREAERLQKEIDAKQEDAGNSIIVDENLTDVNIPRTINEAIRQEETYFDPNPVMKEYREKQEQLDKIIQEKTESKDEKLSVEELQTVIAGFESYNKSVKMLLDMCVAVESEDDFRFLGSLIDESGEKFLESTVGYGAVRNTLIAEGNGDHPELGPLIDQSVILVEGMSTCMAVLAWEFSG